MSSSQIVDFAVDDTAQSRIAQRPPHTDVRRIVRCADEVICCDDERSRFWYRVVTGAARYCAALPDGRRRVIDFLLPGDLFRVYSLPAHRTYVEAIVTPTQVMRNSRAELERLAANDETLAGDVDDAAPRAIMRLQAHAVLLGHASALERVADFLLEYSRRCGADDHDFFVLPMSRSDIADYLGIAVESVSRALTQLRRSGAIDLAGPKRVRIAMRSRLDRHGEPHSCGTLRMHGIERRQA
jgi:CRP/FNR family nitrogen fixation transcriptional regulator